MAPSGHWQSLPHSPARLVSLTTMFIGVHSASFGSSDVGGSDGGSGGGDGGGVATQCQRIAAGSIARQRKIFTPTSVVKLRKHAQDSALALPSGSLRCRTAAAGSPGGAHLNRVFVCLRRPFVSGGEKAIEKAPHQPNTDVCVRAWARAVYRSGSPIVSLRSACPIVFTPKQCICIR